MAALKNIDIKSSYWLVGLAITLIAGCTVAPPTQEMSDARQSVEAAQSAGANELAPRAMDSAQDLLDKAEDGMRSGNYDEAQQDAIAAREAAHQALAISEVKQTQPPSTPPPPVEAIKPISAPIVEKVEVTLKQYQVRSGDSLWTIAAQAGIYGDAELWPLIFRINGQTITDADLIYPGQVLRIELRPSQINIDAAKAHSQSRGSWQLGLKETADMSYINRSSSH